MSTENNAEKQRHDQFEIWLQENLQRVQKTRRYLCDRMIDALEDDPHDAISDMLWGGQKSYQDMNVDTILDECDGSGFFLGDTELEDAKKAIEEGTE